MQFVDEEYDLALEPATSLSTALSRSSNSPRYFAPAISAPMSSETIRLFFKPSGTSPRTMRCASPSTIAVLPTPGSPISTGLFLVRRESTWTTRRISSSRPMTGSSLPARLQRQVAAVAFERLIRPLGILGRHALVAAHVAQRRSSFSRVSPESRRMRPTSPDAAPSRAARARPRRNRRSALSLRSRRRS